mmetsp:Transcript_1383/g.2092  ORF Transcript_1383/g.2092 Transcript_1383/m.2092 type:complete len:148 (-) Transcript_1383:586-1029(-)
MDEGSTAPNTRRSPSLRCFFEKVFADLTGTQQQTPTGFISQYLSENIFTVSTTVQQQASTRFIPSCATVSTTPSSPSSPYAPTAGFIPVYFTPVSIWQWPATSIVCSFSAGVTRSISAVILFTHLAVSSPAFLPTSSAGAALIFYSI